MNKIKQLLNRVKNNYKSFLFFVMKLIFWVFVLAWLVPFLAGLVLNTFKSTSLTISDFILFITAAFIIAYTYETQRMGEQITKQTKATEKMAEYQLMPAVDVNMVYENREKRTYFWFSNLSKLPAIASFELIKKNDEECQLHTQSLRISPQQKMCTMAIAFYESNHSTKEKHEFKPSEGDMVTLNICIKLAFEKSNIEYTFKKDYKFHEYPSGSKSYRWDENSWGYPDPSWPS